MARPPIEIDAEQVLKLAQLGCKTEEIADYFKCSTDTIQRRFAAELTKGRADLRMSLRRWQLASAQKGNVVMLIWLGKQMLGQYEKQTLAIQNVTGMDNAKLASELERVAHELKEK